MKFYNVARKLYLNNIPLIPKLIKFIMRVVFSATIPYTCSIDEGTRFPHGGQGVVLHEETIIGKNCTIQTNVVIGGRNGTPGAPKIGDNVLVGTGAVILGNIEIGNNAAVGANSVVTKSVPERAVVTGIPGVVVRYLDEGESIA